MPDDINPVPPGSMMPGDSPTRPSDAIAPGTPVVRPGADGLREGRPEIVLNPKAATRPIPGPKKAEAPKTTETKDSVREVVETIVFVVVLVLLLKTFLAEAFVIPTGSMATTLLGYHREVRCEKCEYKFLVNASKQFDPQEPHPQHVINCTCPNCEFTNRIAGPMPGGGR
jgi:Signal peptidase, peptidase S26